MTAPSELDILGVGNAIVDVLARADDAVLLDQGLAKGGMTLIDAERAAALTALVEPTQISSGGSGANTVTAAASFGVVAGFVGKVGSDELGAAFARDIRAAGVRFDTVPLTGPLPTARSLILVSPDGQRTMSTYLGACTELGPDDVDGELVSRARVTYLEGYLFDEPGAREAVRVATAAARAAGRRTALTLSDVGCVERHRAEFLRLLDDGEIDVLVANEHELRALSGIAELDRIVGWARVRCPVVAVTRSENGSIVADREGVHEVPAEPVAAVVDTTGAGDAYAAGFLVGLTRGRPLPVCARLGSVAAAEVIAHFGARPQRDLAELAAPVLDVSPSG